MKRYSRALVAVAALAIAACSLATDSSPEGGRVTGIIEWRASAVVGAATADPFSHMVVSAPDTVQVNVPFTATITTIGASGCWRADGAHVEPGARLATVTPWDFVTTEIDSTPTFCTGALVSLPRDVQLLFSEGGAATLRVRGRVVTNADVERAGNAVVEKTIVVR